MSQSTSESSPLSFSFKFTILLAMLAFFSAGTLNAQNSDISSSYVWNQLRIGGGGFVTGLAMHPTTANLIYARTDTGGAYKWNASAGLWAEMLTANNVPSRNLNQPNDYAVESIAVSAKNDQVVYVAIGTDSNGRILKSSDQGETWSDSGQRWYVNGNGDYREGGERLAVDPNNNSIVYFGSRTQGLWVSNNSGSSWTQVSPSTIPVGSNATGTEAGVSFVAFDPTGGTVNETTQRIYVGVAGSGIYETTNAGSSWSQILSVSSIPYAGKVSADGTLWVSFSAYESNGSLQAYNPTSQAWTNVSPSSASFWSFAVDPFNSQRVIAGAGGFSSGSLYLSTNEGGSWTPLNLTLSAANIPWVAGTDEYEYLSSAEMQFDPTTQNRLWFPEGTGIWTTDDESGSSINWTNTSEGIENTIATDVIAPSGVAVTGIFDREGFYHSNPNSYPSRTHIDTVASPPQLWGGTSLDFEGSNPQYQVLAEVQNNSGSAPSRGAYSADGGNTWNLFASDPAVGTGGNIAVSSSDATDIVWLPSTNNFGSGNIPFFTNDQGVTWHATSGISSTATHWFYYWGAKKALDSDKVLSGKFYLLTFDNNGTFYVSTDGGQSFQQAPYAPVCSENDNCHYDGQLKAVPGMANNIWSTDPLDGLYYTTDAGQTAWTKVAGVTACYALGFGVAAPGATYPTVYISGTINSQNGIYRSIDQGATWQLITAAPLGIYNMVQTISGDMQTFGRVYVGFEGNGFAYGDIVSGTDTLSSASWPTSIPPAGSASVTVQYSAKTNRTLIANLWDSNWNWLGQASQTVSAGSGSATLPVAYTTSITTATAFMRVDLTDGGSNTYGTLANYNIPVGQSVDALTSVNWPSSVTPTGSVTVAAQYSATTTRTLTAYLWDSSWNWEGQTSQTVNAGSGSVNLTVPYSSSIGTSTAYMRVVLTDGGSNTYGTLSDYTIPVTQ